VNNSISENIHNFRWDIQGLRAISVLFVLIFHINPDVLPGGYLGVDIFFVISGYLILGFIWKRLEQNNFSIFQFYTKRIYRLAPAFLTVVVISTLVGYFVLLPNEGLTYIESLVSTLFYFSNFYFYSQSDYFNSTMEFAPLLHTWSLSVEEQFYIVFPIILLMIYKIKKESIIHILLFLALLSLCFSQLAIHYEQNSFAFFASPTRFFQFIIGGIVSIAVPKNTFSRSLNDILMILGLTIIGISVYFYTAQTPTPGINAIWPSFGAVLVLYSGVNTRYTTVLLSNSLFIWIGNISYSLYLWHWPLIVYYKLRFNPILTITEQVLLFMFSIVFGFLSWKYIEERTRGGYLVKFNVFYLHILLSIILAVMSYYIFTVFQSQNVSYKKKVEKYINYDASHEFRASQCFLTSADKSMDDYKTDECVVWTKEKKNYLLIGDSHAAHYYRAMASLLKENETLTQVNASGCVPILSSTWGDKPCKELFKWTFDTLIREKHFDVIIISMANFHHTSNVAIQKSMQYIAEHTDKIVFLGRTMRYKQPLPRLLLKLSKGEESSFIHKIAGDYEYTLNLETNLQEVLKVDKLNYISILKLMCTEEQSCRTLTPEGIPMYFDKDHFTEDGALYILKQVKNDVFDRE